MADVNNTDESMNNTDESIQNNGIPEISLSLSANEGLTNAVDKTLKADGEAADAKTVGDRFDTIEQETLPNIEATLARAVMYDEQAEQTDTDRATALNNIRAVGTLAGQGLTTAQKTNARNNIGAAGSGDAAMVTEGLNTATKQTVLENIGAVGVVEQSELTDAQKKRALKNIGAVGVVQQTGTTGYTTEEKAMARSNIGALGAGEAVSATTGLTAEQKTTVRNNIGAISEDDASSLITQREPFAIRIPANAQIERYTVEDSRITANHAVVSFTAAHPADITWTTAAGSLTVSCTAGIPEMVLMVCIPKTN